MEIETDVRGYILKEVFAGKPPEGFDEDYDLIESGAIDSLSMMNLVMYLEQKHAVVFGINELIPRHFRSIRALSAFVQKK